MGEAKAMLDWARAFPLGDGEPRCWSSSSSSASSIGLTPKTLRVDLTSSKALFGRATDAEWLSLKPVAGASQPPRLIVSSISSSLSYSSDFVLIAVALGLSPRSF